MAFVICLATDNIYIGLYIRHYNIFPVTGMIEVTIGRCELTSLRGKMGMGFLEKLKNIFKKKGAAEDAPVTMTGSVKQKDSPVKRSAQFVGDGAVYDALRYGADKIDRMVEDGTIKPGRADAFIGMLKAIEAEQASDGVKLIEISQTIGGIINS